MSKEPGTTEVQHPIFTILSLIISPIHLILKKAVSVTEAVGEVVVAEGVKYFIHQPC